MNCRTRVDIYTLNFPSRFYIPPMSAVNRTPDCVVLKPLKVFESAWVMKKWKNLFWARWGKLTTLFKKNIICLTLLIIPVLSYGSIWRVGSRGGINDPGKLAQRVSLSQSTSSLFLTTVVSVKLVMRVIYSSFLAPIPNKKPPVFLISQPL